MNSLKLVDRLVANLSVIITTYNRPAALNVVLAGYYDQKIKPKEILIADDGSTEDTARMIELWKTRGLPLQHCWHEDRGFRRSEIINLAITRVTTPYVVFTDGDCVPLRNFVADHALYAEKGYVLAGGRVLASEEFTERLESGQGSCSHRGFLFWLKQRLSGNINRLTPLLRLPDSGWRKASPSDWELVRGCNLSLALDDLINADGYDESFVGWGYEDSDLAVRLINNGIKIKSLRFAAPMLHLWHREAVKTTETLNYRLLMDSIRAKRLRALRGVSVHQR